MVPRTFLVFSLSLGLAACRTAAGRPTGIDPAVAPQVPPGSASEGSQEALVRAHPGHPMPRCTAEDSIALGSLSPGLPAQPALALREGGALVAYRTRVEGHTTLNLLPLNNDRQPGPGVALNLSATPSFPALLAEENGYLLVWRQGTEARQCIAWWRLDRQGRPTGASNASILPHCGQLGPPSIHRQGSERWVVYALREERGTSLVVTLLGGTTTQLPSPEGGEWLLDRAPAVVLGGAGVRVYATAAPRDGTPERAVFEVQAPVTDRRLVARDLDHPSAQATEGGVLLGWRARGTRRDVLARAWWMPDDGDAPAAPLTVATLRGAYETAVTLVPLRAGDGEFAAVTVSALSQDAVGSLNLSLLTARGALVGRASVLTSFGLRDVLPAVASAGATVWVALDGRDSDGTGPELLVTRARCNGADPVPALDVPGPAFPQEPLDPVAPAARLAEPSTVPEATCTVERTGTMATLQYQTNDPLRETTGAVVVTATGVLTAAQGRPPDAQSPALILGWSGATGVPTVRSLSGVSELLAADNAPGGALLAFNRGAALSVAFAGGPGRLTEARDVARDVTSALVLPGTARVFFVRREAEGARSLWQTTWLGARTAPATRVLTLGPRDSLVDAMPGEGGAMLLLERADSVSGEVSRSVAALTVPEHTATGALSGDPFADPLGFPSGLVQWAWRTAGTEPGGYFTTQQGVLLTTTLRGGEARDPRSLLGLLPGGGALRAASWSGATRWLAVDTGFGENADGPGPLTVLALDRPGTLRGATTRLPGEANALVDSVALGAAPLDTTGARHRVALAWPRLSEGALRLEWRLTVANCALPAAQ